MTILTSLYASGYKFNLSWPLKFNRLLQKTGMLNVSTLPKNADIFLNNKQQQTPILSLFKKDFITTPAKIKNILPGEYTLSLQKEGYWPIEKKIRIDSGQTTFNEDINLFKSDTPLLIYQTENENPVLSANGKYLYLNNAGKIITTKAGLELPFSLNQNDKGLWVKNGDKLFANGKIIDPEKNIEINFADLVGSGTTNWYYDDFNNQIYYSNKDSINRLEPDNKTISTIIKGEEYLSYEPRGDYLFAVVKSGNKLILKEYQIKTGENLGQVELPAIGDYRFKQEDANRLCLYDNKNLTMYLINPTNIQDISKISNIKSWSWINKGELIYNTDWEINIFNITTRKTSLVTRVSEIINSVIWNKRGSYIIFATDKSLNTSTLYDGNALTILRTENISQPVLDENNNLLYFYGQIGQQTGIYKIVLQ